MTSRARETIDLRQALVSSFRQWEEPGAPELCDLLQEMLGNDGCSARAVGVERLKREVYRLRIGSAPDHTLVLKLLRPGIAETDRLVAERWLPALGLGDRCPRLLGAAAQRDGCGIWHVYEDVGHESLAVRREPSCLAAAIDLLVELHTRAAV